MQYSAKEMPQGWFGLSRPPFHTIVVLPFILGNFLAYKFNFTFNLPIFILGVSDVIRIMKQTKNKVKAFYNHPSLLLRQLGSTSLPTIAQPGKTFGRGLR